MQDELPKRSFRVATLPTRKPQRFRLTLDAAERTVLAKNLGITALSDLQFEGEIRADGRNDFRLEGKLRGKVQQPCVVTLAPVVTVVETPVLRRYSANFEQPDAEEMEAPADDTTEALPEVIEILDVALEELALNIPAWPRAKGAELGEVVYTAPDNAPLRDTDLRPFAGLQSLKDKLKRDT